MASLGGPDATDATLIFQELTGLSIALQDLSVPPSAPEIVSRLTCISTRCTGGLEILRGLVDRASRNAIHDVS